MSNEKGDEIKSNVHYTGMEDKYKEDNSYTKLENCICYSCDLANKIGQPCKEISENGDTSRFCVCLRNSCCSCISESISCICRPITFSLGCALCLIGYPLCCLSQLAEYLINSTICCMFSGYCKPCIRSSEVIKLIKDISAVTSN